MTRQRKQPAMTAERFRHLLKRHRISQSEAAVILGVNQSTISRWYSGKTPISRANYSLIQKEIRNLS